MAKILIIEDDQSLIELYQHTLIAEGHDVLTAHDGAEGLEKAKIFRPELVISDYVMPKASGIDVFIQMKKDPALAGCKLLLVTSLLLDKENMKAMGADDVLMKIDIMPEVLVKKVESLLNPALSPS